MKNPRAYEALLIFILFLENCSVEQYLQNLQLKVELICKNLIKKLKRKIKFLIFPGNKEKKKIFCSYYFLLGFQ